MSLSLSLSLNFTTKKNITITLLRPKVNLSSAKALLREHWKEDTEEQEITEEESLFQMGIV